MINVTHDKQLCASFWNHSFDPVLLYFSAKHRRYKINTALTLSIPEHYI